MFELQPPTNPATVNAAMNAHSESSDVQMMSEDFRGQMADSLGVKLVQMEPDTEAEIELSEIMDWYEVMYQNGDITVEQIIDEMKNMEEVTLTVYVHMRENVFTYVVVGIGAETTTRSQVENAIRSSFRTNGIQLNDDDLHNVVDAILGPKDDFDSFPDIVRMINLDVGTSNDRTRTLLAEKPEYRLRRLIIEAINGIRRRFEQ